MLAIHISQHSLKYAQLVNFKGAPFIEGMGEIPLDEVLHVQDMANGELTRILADHIANIRNSAEFPDNATHLVIDADWFPFLIHDVDAAVRGKDLSKYLKWRMLEMLDGAAAQFDYAHQKLEQEEDSYHRYFSIAIPESFNQWVGKITGLSELVVNHVITDIESIGTLMSGTGLMDSEDGLELILENQAGRLRGHLYQNHEFCAFFQANVNWDYRLTLDVVRGDQILVKRIAETLEKAIKGKRNPDTVLDALYYFNTSGDKGVLKHLEDFSECAKPLDLVNRFNFREPEFDNIDGYAVVLGALSTEIKERFLEA